MEIDGSNENLTDEFNGKNRTAPQNWDTTRQQKTAVESGDGDEMWITSFLNQKGIT